LTDPEWWTSIAVDLLDWKPGSLAKDLAKLLKKERQSVPHELRRLYQSVIQHCLEKQGIAVNVSKARTNEFDVSAFDPRFPMAHPVFHEMLEYVKGQATKHIEDAEATQQTASEHCLHRCGMKPTVLDQRNPSDLHILALLP
jgi:hypothetical protein